MADGAIRINTIIDIKNAKAKIKELEKTLKDAESKKEKINSSSEMQTLKEEYDIEQQRYEINLKLARNESERAAVERDHDGILEQMKIRHAELIEKASRYNDVINNTKSELESVKQTYNGFVDQKNSLDISAAEDKEKEKVKNNYNNLIAKQDKMTAMGVSPDSKSYRSLQYDIQKAKDEAKRLGIELDGANNSAKRTSTRFAKLKNFLSSATNAAKGMAKAIGGAALNGVKKLGSSIKSKLVNGFKSGASQAESIRKKLMKMSLALIGMRGIWGGIRQLVSSALSNNDKLQNQLTAVKGVLGQALTPAINVLVQALGKVATFADEIYQHFTGVSLIAQYNASQQKKAADNIKDQTKNAKELKRQLASFDVINKLSDDSSDNSNDSNSSGDETPMFKKADISGWLSDIIDQIKKGDWYSVGETVAGAINSALYKIDWKNIQDKVNTFCTNLGKAVNGFVDALDWGAVGNAFGEGLNTLTGAVNSFVDTVNWDNLGAGLSEGLNKAVQTIDGKALGKTLSAKLKILTDTLYGFFNGNGDKEGFNFKSLGNTIGDTVNGWFENIDWKKAGSNITSAIAGLGDIIAGAADSIDWSSITKSIEDFFGSMDWGNALSKLFTGFGKALGGMGSVVVQLLKDAWTNWKKDYLDAAIDDCGGSIIEGVFVGIGRWLKDVGTWIKDNIFKPFIDGFKSTFEIHSPSKNPEILDLGKNLIIGVFNGIVNWIKDVKTWFKNNVFNKITEAWSDFKGLTLSIGAKITAKWKDLKAKWNKERNKFKGKTAHFGAKITAKWNELKKKWDKKKKDFTGKTVSLTAKFKDAVTKALNTFINKINTLLGKLRAIKVGPLQPFKDIKNIPKLARGGIVNNPGAGIPAIVGEAGPEAILPLNDNVLGKIASMMNGQQGTGQIVIPVYLDSRQIAKYTVDAMNKRAFEMNTGGAY